MKNKMIDKEYDATIPVYKAFSSDVEISPSEDRTVSVVASTATVDHSNEVLIPDGCLTNKTWDQNPVIFFMHDGDKIPVARGLAIQRNNAGVRVKFRFIDRPPTHPKNEEWLPDTLWWMFKNKGLNAVSVGFLPVEGRIPTDRDLAKYGPDCEYIHAKWTLLELSVVNIPCNPDAVVQAISKGMMSKNSAKMFGADPKDALTAAIIVKGLKTPATREPLERTYSQYYRHGDTLEPTGDIKLQESLGNDAYRIIQTWTGVGFVRMQAQTDELYTFDNSVMTETLAEIDKFWDLKADYDKLGLMHNRGMLLYGPPGTGKTSVLHQVSDMIVGRGDVVFYAKSVGTLADGLRAFREVEPDRKVVVMLEDADEYIGYEERHFLQLLDGEESVAGVLYLATTNYLERFPQRLLRPGRFDKKVLVDPPPYEGRYTYLLNKLKDVEKDEEIKRLARETDGLSFGHLRELVTAVYALKEPVAQVLQRLRGAGRAGKRAFENTVAKMLSKSDIAATPTGECKGCQKSFPIADMTPGDDGDYWCDECYTAPQVEKTPEKTVEPLQEMAEVSAVETKELPPMEYYHEDLADDGPSISRSYDLIFDEAVDVAIHKEQGFIYIED